MRLCVCICVRVWVCVGVLIAAICGPVLHFQPLLHHLCLDLADGVIQSGVPLCLYDCSVQGLIAPLMWAHNFHILMSVT